jgi:hypothetical protein
MYRNMEDVNEPVSGEPFEQRREAIKNRMRWRIRRVHRALKARAGIESQAAEARRPIYAIGDDPLPENGCRQRTAINTSVAHTNLTAKMGVTTRDNSKIMTFRNIKPLVVDAIQMSGPTDVPTSGGVLRGRAGDWLVRDPQGNVKLCDNLYFINNYAPLKDSQPLEQFSERTSRGGC